MKIDRVSQISALRSFLPGRSLFSGDNLPQILVALSYRVAPVPPAKNPSGE